jgi:hypothetical protein
VINKNVYLVNSGVALSPHFYSFQLGRINTSANTQACVSTEHCIGAECKDEDWCERCCDTLNRQGIITHLVVFLSLLLWSFVILVI